MIVLKRLEVNNFKGLRSIAIVFPERGSVLIEGHNEAGKSTLFEAIYVGLYGKPLVGEEAVAKKDEVIQYGQSRATVRLEFRVGQQALTVLRSFERGKAQQATLIIHRPGVEPEVINKARSVDERILMELGNLDGDSLRNSCFVEQKELGRIEALSLQQREQAIQKLLGLERLTKLMDQFKFRREQERQLTLAQRRLKLAKLQAGVQATSIKEAELTERLDAVKVSVQLKRLSELEQQRNEMSKHLAECATRAKKAQERLDHCASLRGYLVRCDQASRKLEDISFARQERDRLAGDLTRLNYIEQIELPRARVHLNEVSIAGEAVARTAQARQHVQEAGDALREVQRRLEELEQAEDEQRRRGEELSQAKARLQQRREEAQAEQQRITQRLNELAAQQKRLENAATFVQQWETAYGELQALQQEISAAEAKERDLFSLQTEVGRRENDVRELQVAVEGAERLMQQAAVAVRQAAAYEVLTAWMRLKGVELALHNYATRHVQLLAREQEARAILATTRAKTRAPLALGIALIVVGIVAAILGLVWLPAFAFAVVFLGGAAAAGIWFLNTRKGVRNYAEALAQSTLELQRLDMQRQAAIDTGGDPATLAQYEQQLQASGIPVPTSPEAGRSLQEELRRHADPELGQRALQERAQAARDSYTRLAEQLRLAQSALDESRRSRQLAQRSDNPAEFLSRLRTRAAQQEESVTGAEQQAKQATAGVAQWPTNSNALHIQLSSCQTELRSIRDIQQQREQATTALIREADADRVKAEEALLQVQSRVATLKASDPAGQLMRAQHDLTQVQSACHEQEAALLPLLQKLRLRAETEVEPARGRAEANIQALEQQLEARLSLEAAHTQRNANVTHLLTAAFTMMKELVTAASTQAVPHLPSLPEISEDAKTAPPPELSLSTTLSEIRQAIDTALAALNEQEARNILEEAFRQQGSLNQLQANIEGEIEVSRREIEDIFTARGIAHPAEFRRDDILSSWPLVASISPDEEGRIKEQLDSTRNQLFALRQEERQLTAELQHPGAPLSIEECQQKVEELIEERQICEIASQLLRETHDRIARRVLPITERNMQPLLQQLTGGRYCDVRLTPEENDGQQSGMDYRIRIWDPAANRYVAKNLFSGGTRDQCSLALRLAFALATLPQELGVAPGFIFLDEPLSAFDAQRVRALVGLLTTGIIAQQFSQVVLISHYHAFDREVFRYHIRMEAGQIVESDLPEGEESENDVSQILAVSVSSAGERDQLLPNPVS